MVPSPSMCVRCDLYCAAGSLTMEHLQRLSGLGHTLLTFLLFPVVYQLQFVWNLLLRKTKRTKVADNECVRNNFKKKLQVQQGDA